MISNNLVCRGSPVSAHRRMWSITNYFVLNLSLADILMAGLNCSFSFIYMRDRSAVCSVQILRTDV